MTRPPSDPSGVPSRRVFGVALAAVLAAAGLPGISRAAEQAVKIPPLADAPAEATAARETAVFAGGCFWGVQGVFQHTKGVLNAVSGYAGGSEKTARYEIVGSGLTGHAEAVQVTFDPKQVSYAQLLQIFFSVAHDPTQLNRQGPDRGTQYRSALFTTTPAQKQAAERYIAQLDAAKAYPAKIVTQVGPLVAFYPAEDYHQDYATLHPESGYIATFDLPKIANLKTMFALQYRAEPVLVSRRVAGR
ncbi:MAG TPA: peptide-methionine (S)-S-oxide reductase MsrA [Burkholderiaceae bacterium]|nr:peptide-methionine (S)-S-oxide reductase MsrA [Burkholderiaceae bacterium]